MNAAQIQARRWPIALALLVGLAAFLHGRQLADAPIHVHYDEIYIALEAQSIAETGHDRRGRFLPLYFNIFENVWYQPAAIYFTALILKLLPLGDAAIRTPTVLVTLATIVLTFFVGCRIFKREPAALLAATLLAFTPALLMHSRVAVDYMYPLPFILAWLLGLLAYHQTQRLWLLFAATSSLGLGFYSYIASVAMMPVYFCLTLALLGWQRASWRTCGVALAGFGWPLLLLPAFLLAHPELIGDFQQRYSLESAGAGLNPLQRLRDTINTRTVSERAHLFHSFFSPGFLFVSGGSNVINTTREAGVFLASYAILMLAGAYDIVTRPTLGKALILAGFVTAPLAACIVLESYAIDRALALLPFGALLATAGALRLWESRPSIAVRKITLPLATGLLLLGASYMMWTLSTSRAISNTPPLLILAAASIFITGREIDRRRNFRPAVVLLLLVAAVEYRVFYRDYFGDYRARSAAWLGNNIEGAIDRVVALDAERPAPAILLSSEVRGLDGYWRFYSMAKNRRDLLAKAHFVNVDVAAVGTAPAGSLILCPVSESCAEQAGGEEPLTVVATVTDPNEYYSLLGPGEHVTFVVYRKESARRE